MRSIAIIAPFYNESGGLPLFLDSVVTAFAGLDCRATFFLVDDGSTDDSAAILREYARAHPATSLNLVSLEFNTGHQAAIYEGLKKASSYHFDSYLILDSDGQDDPAILPNLLANAGYDIVWVRRSSRQEGIPFRIGYLIYQLIYRIITGKKIDFGNYSLISHKTARYLVVKRFIHYPTALLKSPLTKTFVSSKRLARTYGESKMSAPALVHHAFLSFVEDADIVVNFFLKCTFAVLIFFVMCIANVLYQKFIAHTAILGWTSITGIGLLNLVFLSFGLFAISLSILKIGRVNVPEYQPQYEDITAGSGPAIHQPKDQA